jgi:hypothetical protein
MCQSTPTTRILQGLCAAMMFGMVPGWIWAQSPAKVTASTVSKNKPKQAKTDMAKSIKSLPSAEPDIPMGPDELAIADRVHKGQLPCELGTTVRLEADVSQPGYFYLHGKGFRYRMHPVATSTGTIRLEDRKAGAVWLQLANKSMLMDQNKGRRLADECANAEQMAFAEDMKSNPPPSLIDTTGMGR